MDEIRNKRNDKIIKTHLAEFDIIMRQIMEELGDVDLSSDMLNDIYKLAFEKWSFLYKYGFIKKAPLK